MQELYSKAEDCYELYKTLRKKMGNKIEYSGTPYTELFEGKYFSHYREPHSDLDYLYERGLPFYYKFCKDGFLRISVGGYYHNTSVGEKLAALSEFYEVLSQEFGEPTVFYTTKNDDEGLLSMQWSFINKEEEIQKFKEGTYFDDAEIDELIIIGESKQKTNDYRLSDITKKIISEHIGLPFELLLSLVDENIEDFVKFKTGKELSIPEGAKIDGIPVISFEKEMSLKRAKKS